MFRVLILYTRVVILFNNINIAVKIYNSIVKYGKLCHADKPENLLRTAFDISKTFLVF